MSFTVCTRHAQLSDAAGLADFAARTYAETFGALTHPDDLAQHLASEYGVVQQSAEIATDGAITLVTETKAELVAFAQIRCSPGTACVTTASPVELRRFCVDAPARGSGVAQSLMAAALTGARGLGGASVWLSVWEHNPRAIAFYAKCGFRDVGSADFFVGSDRQTDRIMVRELSTDGRFMAHRAGRGSRA